MYFFQEQINFLSFSAETFLSIYIVINLLFITELRKFYYLYKNNSSLKSYLYIQTITVLIIVFVIAYITSICVDTDLNSSRALLLNSVSTINLKLLIIIFSLLASGSIFVGLNIEKINSLEFYIIYLFSLLSVLLLLSANDFLLIYLLIEMQSLCFYIMTNLNKKNVLCAEAGLRYFLLGSIASCLLVFGLSLIYGALGTLNFHDLAVICSTEFPNIEYGGALFIAVFGLFFVILALFFKLGVFPFSFWLPGVYANIPIASTIVISYLPKLIYFYIFIKLFLVCNYFFHNLFFIFTFSGIITILIGSYFAMNTRNFKDFINCSSISQIGFPICLLGNGAQTELSFIYFFVVLYTFNTIGLWIIYTIVLNFKYGDLNACTSQLETVVELRDVTFFCKKNFLFSYLFSIFFISNGALPPFGGFFIKNIILYDLILQKQFLLGVFLVIVSAFSFFYYFRIIVNIFFYTDITKNTSVLVQTDSYVYFYNILCFIIILFTLTFTLFYIDFIFLFCDKIVFADTY
jgi:NADH-quinone oxidoreductase subunit N